MRNTVLAAGFALSLGCAMFGQDKKAESKAETKSETRTAQDQAQ